jgi:hypothetical protein
MYEIHVRDVTSLPTTQKYMSFLWCDDGRDLDVFVGPAAGFHSPKAKIIYSNVPGTCTILGTSTRFILYFNLSTISLGDRRLSLQALVLSTCNCTVNFSHCHVSTVLYVHRYLGLVPKVNSYGHETSESVPVTCTAVLLFKSSNPVET